ncbi:hypothetical protein, partial [Flindersiella endophytica]
MLGSDTAARTELHELADSLVNDTLSAPLLQARMALVVVTGLAAVLAWVLDGLLLLARSQAGTRQRRTCRRARPASGLSPAGA